MDDGASQAPAIAGARPAIAGARPAIAGASGAALAAPNAFAHMRQSSRTIISWDRNKAKRERLKRKRQADEERARQVQEQELRDRERKAAQQRRLQASDDTLVKQHIIQSCVARPLILERDHPPEAEYKPQEPFIGCIREIDYRTINQRQTVLRCIVIQHGTNATVQLQITDVHPYFYMKVPACWLGSRVAMQKQANAIRVFLNEKIPLSYGSGKGWQQRKPQWQQRQRYRPRATDLEELDDEDLATALSDAEMEEEDQGEDESWEGWDDDGGRDRDPGLSGDNKSGDPIRSIQLVQKSSSFGYNAATVKDWFFKIFTSIPDHVTKARDLLSKSLPGIPTGSAELFECNVPFVTRMMIDHSLRGFGWLKLDAGSYQRTDEMNRTSSAAMEITASAKHLHEIPAEGEWAKVATLRTVSIDCEMLPDGKKFPKAEKDPIVNIVARLSRQFASTEEKGTTYAFCLDSCASKEADEKSGGDTKILSYPILPRIKERAREAWRRMACIDTKISYAVEMAISALTSDTPTAGQAEADAISEENRRVVKEALAALRTIPHRQRSMSWDALVAILADYAECTQFRRTETFLKTQRECECCMLRDFMLVMHQLAPHILTGYNVAKFDCPYLVNRMETLDVKEGKYWGCTMDPIVIKERIFRSAATGTQKRLEYKTPGLIVFDMFVIMLAEHKLESYKLEDVATEFLKMHKKDVHYEDIGPMWNGTDETRWQLLDYCKQDTVLPEEIMVKLQKLTRQIELCRATGLTLPELILRGKQAQVFSCMLREFIKHDLLVPYRPQDAKNLDTYAGAFVLDPRRGFYTDPLCALDMLSLYPTLMIAYNLCYTTDLESFSNALRVAATLPHGWNDIHVTCLLRRPPSKATYVSEAQIAAARRLEGFDAAFTRLPEPGETDQTPKELTRTQMGNCTFFVKEHVKKGKVSQVELDLLDKRKAVKKLQKAAPVGSDESAILDARQLAVKQICNSLYGAFSGQMYPNQRIGETITELGTRTILKCKATAEAMVCKKTGYPEDSKVIVSDTDSIYLLLKGMTLQQALDLGPTLSKAISATLPKGMSLEFEKVYLPYLVTSKKRYTGLKHEPGTNGAIKTSFDAKGNELARRGNTAFLKNTMKKCVDILMQSTKENLKTKIKEARKLVKDSARQLLKGEVEFKDLIMTASFSKLESEYKTIPAHVRLVERMRRRNADTAPVVGDRMQLVYQTAHKNAKEHERVEDASYARDKKNGVTLDYQHYFERKFWVPFGRLFAFILFPKEGLKLSDDPKIAGDTEKVKKEMKKLAEQASKALFGEVPQLVRATRCLTAKSEIGKYFKVVA